MLGRSLYGALSRGLHLAAPLLLSGRARGGKEDPARRNQRFAHNLPDRPDGPLIWMHGASVGESLLLHALAGHLQAHRPDTTILFTSQTLTSARLIDARLTERQIHQIAPIDSPTIARRFARHWSPDLTVIAEGEIWPNLLRSVKAEGGRLALINARMTEKSLRGWSRWRGFARELFSGFDLLLAADGRTADGLSTLAGRPVTSPGNLKTALPPPIADPEILESLQTEFIAGRPCLLAASTHDGEEALFLDALSDLNRPVAAIIAPRHPERAEAILQLLSERGLPVAQWSAGETPTQDTDILLADTIGEMGLWLRLAGAVYLGGAHAPGIGGHNPIEALRLGKPVLTGPDGFNFADVFPRLIRAGALTVAEDGPSLTKALRATLDGTAPAADMDAVEAFLAEAETPLRVTLDGLLNLLDEAPHQ